MTTGKREKHIKWTDPEADARDPNALSGLAYLEAIRDGKTSPPPVAMLVGYKVTEIAEGTAVYELQPEECHYNPFKTVHGGIISTLLDTTMTASVLSMLPVGAGCATVEIKVNFIRPVTVNTGLIRCVAKPIHVGNRLAIVEGRVKDGRDVLYAHGMSTCSIFKTGAKFRA